MHLWYVELYMCSLIFYHLVFIAVVELKTISML